MSNLWTPPQKPIAVQSNGGTKTKMYDGLSYPLYNGEISLEYYDRLGRATHVYMVDGQRIISVSTVTSMATPHSAMMWWAVNEARDYLQTVLMPGVDYTQGELDIIIDNARKAHNVKKEKAATIGTIAHHWISEYINAKINDGDINIPRPIEDKANNAIDAFLCWESQHHVIWLSTERPVYSVMFGYCGTMDWEGIVDDLYTAGDFKTSKAIRESYYFQLAAYVQAREEEERGRVYDDRMILHLDKEPDSNGNVHFEARSIGMDEEQCADFQAFRGLHIAHRRLSAIAA